MKSEKFFPKSKKENENWTFLKMSKNENPKKLSRKNFKIFATCVGPVYKAFLRQCLHYVVYCVFKYLKNNDSKNNLKTSRVLVNYHVLHNVPNNFILLFQIIVTRTTHGFHNQFIILVGIFGMGFDTIGVQFLELE